MQKDNACSEFKILSGGNSVSKSIHTSKTTLNLPSNAEENLTRSQIQHHNKNYERYQKTKTKSSSTIKFKFHNQALPQEYLIQTGTNQNERRTFKTQQSVSAFQKRNPSEFDKSNSDQQYQSINSHENVCGWLQKITEIQKTANASEAECYRQSQQRLSYKNIFEPNENPTYPNASSTSLKSHLTMNTEPKSSSELKQSFYYSNLPYMGEMTLDNCKPRRGRKPKKVDICNLIYKNYGTILPKRSDTQEYSYYATGSRSPGKDDVFDQPLNLCLSDQQPDCFSMSSGDEVLETNSSCTTSLTTPSDLITDYLLASNLSTSLHNFNEEINKPLSEIQSSNSAIEEKLLNPVSVFYRQLLENGVLTKNIKGSLESIQKHDPSNSILQNKIEKTVYDQDPLDLKFSKPLSTPFIIKSEKDLVAATSEVSKSQPKRKRSAIFIPPLNKENSTTPTTEVNICKFKFTGGSKPKLQEKQMLSVDAGGNYRYFRGTNLSPESPPVSTSIGNELLKRSELRSEISSVENCSRQNVSIDIHTSTNSMLLSQTSQVDKPLNMSQNASYSKMGIKNSKYQSSSPNTSSASHITVQQHDLQYNRRKSTQREKLQKTFKEQGFLVQTQQLESAEGATYCKFRQLNKFTRYLFRNWREYLPDDLQQNFDPSASELSTNSEDILSANDTC